MDAASNSSLHKWLITAAVMLVAIIEVLDMTIVNVALPHMMGSLGANSEQITWVLTSYIVAAAVCMPLTGFLVARFGRKRLLLINIVGFMLSSMLCGMAINLTQIIVFRTLQGVFGATLVPLSQYMLRDTFPQEEQGKAMAIWGVGIMAAPIFGPTIGGYITDILDWRWIFYINIPVCIIAFMLSMRVITETPRTKGFIDWVGLFWMILGIGSLQIFLDQGNQNNWLESNFMTLLLIVTIVSLTIFIVRGWRYPKNIINLHLFKDRNFMAATLILSTTVMGLFGIMAIQPIMLEHLFQYPVDFVGLIMAPRGMATAVSMLFVGVFIGRLDPRRLIITGLLLCATGSFLTSHFSLEMDYMPIIYTGAIQGLGMGLVFVPLLTLALSTLPKQHIAEGSGMFSFGRSLGTSIGISVISTILSRQTQANWNHLGGHVMQANGNLQLWLNAHQLNLDNPITAQLIGAELNRQSMMIAFNDCAWVTAISFLLLIPLVFLLKKPEKLSKAALVGH